MRQPKPRKTKLQSPVVDPQSLPPPENVEDCVHRGMAFYARKQYELAIQDFRKAVALDARSEDGHYGLGLAYKALNKGDAAVEAFKKVIELLAANTQDSHDRKEMLHRLALGHINVISSGDWNLEKEIWIHVNA
jgi:tetratricopeptide (TPR) repeat protein